MTSLTDELDNRGRFWYDRARSFYSASGGNPTDYREQVNFWFDEPDVGQALIAWDLVQMEEDEDAIDQ